MNPRKLSRLNRRRFIAALCLAAPGAIAADARLIEPTWLKVRRLRLNAGPVSHRFVHFTDLHFKGDREFMVSVVKRINGLNPDFVCFTGDLIEHREHLSECLEILSGIRAPLYGVPGNHDYWARVPFSGFIETFAATGGAWLMDEQREIDGAINIIGITCMNGKIPAKAVSGMKNILLMHYPFWVKKVAGEKFDLMLAGHSHGGQVRIPFYGALIVPWGVDEYEMGLFQTSSGPLYVNPGIGWWPMPIRFNCRPELTLIEI